MSSAHSESLPVFLSNADFDIAVGLVDVSATTPELPAALAFCRHFRIKGIASLFLTGTTDSFRRALANSGRAFLSFLTRVPEQGQATGRAVPFFDAVAALDVECARQIAEWSRRNWNQRREYEDDFLYMRFLMDRFILSAPASEWKGSLARWNEVVDGGEDAKLALCLALASGDADAFHDALCAWLAQESDKYAELIAADAVPPEIAATEACLSIEGLALVRLAEESRFKLANDYPMIPSLARSRTPITFQPDAWREVRK